jgi:hypothetical protein
MQAKALRSAVDSGLEVPPEVIDLAIQERSRALCQQGGRAACRKPSSKSVCRDSSPTAKGGGGGTIAMAACGVVCLQEFGQYDDWRIPKNMEVIQSGIGELPRRGRATAACRSTPTRCTTSGRRSIR